MLENLKISPLKNHERTWWNLGIIRKADVFMMLPTIRLDCRRAKKNPEHEH